MSLDSLNALKSLIQVREQNANVQEEGRERVQQSVQQQGTSEAQRTDQLGLEKLKAEYEVALLDAKVKRLQAQEAREEKGYQLTQLAAIGGTILSVGSNMMDLMKQGDKKSGDSVFSSSAKGDLLGGQDLNSFKSEQKISTDGKISTVTEQGGAGALVLKSGSIGNPGEESVVGVSVGKVGEDGSGGKQGITSIGLANIDTADKQAAMMERGYLKLDDKSTEKLSKLGVSFSDNGTSISVDLSKADRSELKKMGLLDGAGQFSMAGALRNKDLGLTFDDTKSSLPKGLTKDASFDAIAKADPALGKYIFDKTAKDVNKEQAGKILADVKGGGFEVNDGSKNPNQTTGVKDPNSDLTSIKTFNANGGDMASDYFDKTGKTKSTMDGVMGGAKAITNSLVSIAQDVVPLFDAMLKMKDRLENTREELKAAQEKLAAAARKLKSIENVINNAGSKDGDVQETQMGN